jgi:hypothetical protein
MGSYMKPSRSGLSNNSIWSPQDSDCFSTISNLNHMPTPLKLYQIGKTKTPTPEFKAQ